MTTIEIVFYLTLLLLTCLYVFVRFLLKRSYQKGYSEGVKDIGLRIQSDSYWFSYDTKIFNTLFIMGKSIKTYGYSEVSRLRDEVKELGDKSILKKIENETN